MNETSVTLDGMWEKYLMERSGISTIRNEVGFVTYVDSPETNTICIPDLYVEAAHRKSPEAPKPFHQVMELARSLGRVAVTGFVRDENITYVQSLKAQLTAGFRISAYKDETVYTYLRVDEYFEGLEEFQKAYGSKGE